MVNTFLPLKSTYVICYENIAYRTAIKIYIIAITELALKSTGMSSNSTCGYYKSAIKVYVGVIKI